MWEVGQPRAYWGDVEWVAIQGFCFGLVISLFLLHF